ncbi:carbon storage regulator [Xanthomonas citri]|uniref:carbon storage regulator n=1 Tax=Xanthomonas citri TaxID=346 RepID=UPI000CCF3003|nr:carbon storage regulator [Xanthomonas citri]PNV26664.1 hypothetical protein xavtCFBP7764_22460 [Xanthomonas citri]
MDKTSPMTVTEFTLDVQQCVRIGDQVLVKLSKINKLQARFLIEAPRDVAVWRGEIFSGISSEDNAK